MTNEFEKTQKRSYSVTKDGNEINVILYITLAKQKKEKNIIDWETLESVKPEDRWTFSVIADIKFNDELIRSGQCIDWAEKTYGISEHDISHEFIKTLKLWETYHLNDMQTGTKTQHEALLGLILADDDTNWYEKSCAYLKERGIFDDRGYKFGYGWLFKVIDKNSLTEMKALVGMKEEPQKK